MRDQAQLMVRRTTYYPDRLRSYKVMLDGIIVGSVHAGKSIAIPIAPGTHSLVVQIDWCSSEAINFDVQPHEHIVFECGNSHARWRMIGAFFYMIFQPHNYLCLHRVK